MGNGKAGQVAPGTCPVHRPSHSGAEGAEGGSMREETPISSAGSLRERYRALLTQPVADTVLTWVSKEAGEREPQPLPQGRTQCPVPQKACEWEGGTRSHWVS